MTAIAPEAPSPLLDAPHGTVWALVDQRVPDDPHVSAYATVKDGLAAVRNLIPQLSDLSDDDLYGLVVHQHLTPSLTLHEVPLPAPF